MEDTNSKKKIRIAKNELVNAIDDISTIFDFDDMIDIKEATAREIVDYIEEKQGGEDAFVDSDFEISKKGKVIGLSAETVKTLIAAKITVPSSWKDRLASLNLSDDEPQEDEYQKDLKKAREEEVDGSPADVESEKDIDDEDEKAAKIAEEDAEGEFDDVDGEPAVKPAKSAPKPATKSLRPLRVAVYEKMFTKGATKEEVIKAVQAAVPESSLSTIKTEISDSKNPKYNKLSKLVVENNGKLIFK